MAILTRTSSPYQWLHDRERHHLSCLITRSTFFELDACCRYCRVGFPADLACQRSQLLSAAWGRRPVSRVYSAHGWWVGGHVCRCVEAISKQTRTRGEYALELGSVGTCR